MSDLCKCGHHQQLWPHHEEWIDDGAVHTRDKCESVGDVVVRLRARVAEVERERDDFRIALSGGVLMHQKTLARVGVLEAALRGVDEMMRQDPFACGRTPSIVLDRIAVALSSPPPHGPCGICDVCRAASSKNGFPTVAKPCHNGWPRSPPPHDQRRLQPDPACPHEHRDWDTTDGVRCVKCGATHLDRPTPSPAGAPDESPVTFSADEVDEVRRLTGEGWNNDLRRRVCEVVWRGASPAAPRCERCGGTGRNWLGGNDSGVHVPCAACATREGR